VLELRDDLGYPCSSRIITVPTIPGVVVVDEKILSHHEDHPSTALRIGSGNEGFG
jgi:hypothetical protein